MTFDAAVTIFCILFFLILVFIYGRREFLSIKYRKRTIENQDPNFGQRPTFKESQLTGRSHRIKFTPDPVKIYIPKSFVLDLTTKEYADFIERIEFYFTRNLPSYVAESHYDMEHNRYEITIRPTKG